MGRSRIPPKQILQWRDIIREHALAAGLDFFEVVFEMVDYVEMNELAALGGFPTRYPHWRFGMEYDRLSKSYAYGLSKIYEMVINTDPCYAYLLTSNSLLDQKLVMSHVYGHSDFFKKNVYFSHTNRRMLDEMANHAVRVRRYQEVHGVDKVEEFIDCCLSIDNLLDPHVGAIRRDPKPQDAVTKNEEQSVFKIPTKSYLDKYVNPKEYLEEQKKRIEEAQAREERFPARPQRDVLGFLLQHAPLKDWQRDCLAIVRDEALYYLPQAQTKIMNEGWASYWHAKIMTGGIMNDSEVIDFADVHSGTMATPPGGINPYKIGIELFRDIEERWNKGQFGKEWDECDDYQAKAHWDLKTGKGRDKIFDVRRIYNDLTFIDEFLTEDFCRRQKLFSFAYNKRSERYEIESREFKKVKDRLLSQLTNFGQPVIEVVDGNYRNRGELLLLHRFDGAELRPDYTEKTLRNISRIWGRPVHIETVVDGKPIRAGFEGDRFVQTDLEGVLVPENSHPSAKAKL
jgi:stage V sporulation protein R